LHTLMHFNATGGEMSCIRCQDLERALEARQREYIVALDSAYYRVSTKLAVYIRVELENARNELEEHRSVCTSAVTQPTPSQTVVLRRFARQEELRAITSEMLPGFLLAMIDTNGSSRLGPTPPQTSFKQTT
jgi:hypothetical protein